MVILLYRYIRHLEHYSIYQPIEYFKYLNLVMDDLFHEPKY